MVLLDTAGVVGTGVIQGPSENNTWPFLLEGTPRVNPAAVVWAVTPTSLVSAQTRALTVNSDGQPRASAITGVDRNRLLAAIDRDGDGRADLVLLGWARNHTLSARHQLCRDVHSMVRVRARGAWRTVRHTRSNECRALGPPQERPMRDRPMESP